MFRYLIPFTLCAAPLAASEAPRVVTDIAPIHSLVAKVMEGVGSPQMVVPAGVSPHHHAMRPSEAQMLSDADLVVWIGPSLTRWLEEPVEELAADAHHLTLMSLEGIELMSFREGALFGAHDHDHGHGHAEEAKEEAHDHDDHDHDHAAKEVKAEDHDHDHDHGHDHGDHGHKEEVAAKEEDHDHDHDHDHAHGDDHGQKEEAAAHDDHDHDHEAHAEKADAHAGHDHHDHAGGMDPHIWLDPQNAMTFLAVIAEELAELDPEHAAIYRANAASGQAEIATVMAELTPQLEAVKNQPFLVLHDAYHYFEERFGIEASGAVSSFEADAPGARRVAELKAAMAEIGPRCAFTEPQLDTGFLELITEDLDVKIEVIDPLGADIATGPGHYPALLRAVGGALSGCLGTSS